MRGKDSSNKNKDTEARRRELLSYFSAISESKRSVIIPLIDEFLFLEEELQKLRSLPLIRIHPKNPARQEITPAGKLYKEYMQSYLNALKVLQKTLYMEGETGESALVKMLKEFDNE